MRIVCSTLAFRKYGLREALEKAKALGFDAVELCANPRHSDPERWEMGRDELVACVRRLGLRVTSVHVPIKGQDAFPLAEKGRQEAESSFEALDTAVLLQGEFIVQHLGLLSDGSCREDQNPLRSTVPNLEALLQRARAKNVKVAVENVPSTSLPMFGSSTREIACLLERIPSQSGGLCLDLTHCLACGLDPIEVLQRIDPSRLLSIHASDNLSAPWADRHLPLGAGTIQWKTLFDQLRAVGFQGPFVIEVFDEKDLLDSLQYLASLRLSDLSGFPPLKAFRSDSLPGKGGEKKFP